MSGHQTGDSRKALAEARCNGEPCLWESSGGCAQPCTPTDDREAQEVHDHSGPDFACAACKPLADVLKARMRWASVHWGNLHDDAWPSLARAILASDWLAARDAQRDRAAGEKALRDAAASVSRAVEKVPPPSAETTHASEYWRGYRTAAFEASDSITELADRLAGGGR